MSDSARQIRIVFPLVAALAVRAVAAWVSHGRPVVDVATFEAWATHLDVGQNPFTAKENAANYPPLWVYLCWLCLVVSHWIGLRFDLAVKLLVSCADAATVIPVALIARAREGSDAAARAAALSYAVNPVAILIASFHAQNDPIAVGLVLWSLWLVTAATFRSGPELAALLLGVSFCIKPIGVLFLLLVLAHVVGWRRRAWLFGLACLPMLVTALPFLIRSPIALVQATATYRGPPDFGYVGIFNSWMNLGRGSAGEPVVESLPWWMRLAYLPVFLFVCWRFRRLAVIDQFRAVILSLYLFYGTLAAQYLMWIVPFASAARDPDGRRGSILTAIALVAFYQLHHSGILTGMPGARLQIGIGIAQWSGIFLIAHVLLYVHWLRWIRDLEWPRTFGSEA